MKYSEKQISIIGREVVKKHPEIASTIINSLPPQSSMSLEKIPEFYGKYCEMISVKPDDLRGSVINRDKCEKRKVFAYAMISIYGNKRKLNKEVSSILNVLPCVTTTMTSSGSIRYGRDEEFTEKVNQLLETIK